VEKSAGQVAGDSRRLRESFEHVVRNAVLYTPEGGKISVHAAGNDHEAIVNVVDNGPGIDLEQQGSVFTRFHRAEGTRREAGLGLGLPLTRQFIEAHGGSVELASSPEEGTAVTIVIPRSIDR
jgi:signal transduction histidine kinase